MAFLKSAATHIKEGIRHLQTQDYGKALKSLLYAEKKKPDDPTIKNYISQAYAGLEDLEKANEYIQKAITLDPQTQIHRQLYATYLMKQGKYYEAIPVIDASLAVQPSDVIYILRGQVDYNLGKLDSALRFFDKALEQDPKNPLANHMKGLVYYRLERYAEAIPYLETALSFGEVQSLVDILKDCRARAAG